MTKMQFLLSLHRRLSGLPESEVEERLNFYSEMIEDRMEEGLSEEEAVNAVGSVDEIAGQILTEEAVPPAKRKPKAWEILLLILGAPLWLSLLVAGFAIALSLYVSLWAVVISLWAVFAALIGAAFGCLTAGIGLGLGGKHLAGLGLVSIGLVCAGSAIFLGLGCKGVTCGALWLTKAPFKRRKRNG